ncbi:MAG TPA: type IV secretory system conjugative DNA transfer family protein, partial [Steroidobacteraceae bacterium]|nr:type IV secretory system conjugative DNA transfer family protein [Steroidobacteraceae bacterium]
VAADSPLLVEHGHLLTIAPTGAGKGIGCVIPALLDWPGPVIATDLKGENVAVTARRRRALGQRVIVLDPLGVTGVAGDSLNPLDAFDIGDESAVDDVAALAHLLCAETDDPHNRFWSQRGIQLVTGVTLCVMQEARDAGPGAPAASLVAVRQLVNEAAGDPEALVERMACSRHPEVRHCAHLLRIRAAETLGGIIAFAQAGLDFLRGESISRAIRCSSFDLEDLTRGAPLSLYLVLPPHLLESHGRLLRLWISTLFSAITRRATLPPQDTLFLLDEAAQFGHLPSLRQAITLLRGYGVRTWTFWQDLSQLERLYPADWRSMVNNCAAVQCFGATNARAAAEMAALVGFHDVDAMLALPADRLLLQRAREAPLLARLPDYRTDARYAGSFDANPFHARSVPIARRRSQPQAVLPPAPLAATQVIPPAESRPAWASAGEDDRLLRSLIGLVAP